MIQKEAVLGKTNNGYDVFCYYLSVDFRPGKNFRNPFYDDKRPYTFSDKNFTSQELSFWEDYGITFKILDKYNVKSLRSYASVNSDKKNFSLESTHREPIFGYVGKGFVKLYRPFSTVRFLYGVLLPEHYCFGLEQLPNRGDVLFITGGEKDVMSLSSKGFYAICFNSESSATPQTLIERLRHRFRHIILLYDTDATGLTMSAQREEELKRLILPLSGEKRKKTYPIFLSRNIREAT